MKQIIMLLLVGLLASCGTPGIIQTDNIKGTTVTLTERTVRYIETDESIPEDVKVERAATVLDFKTYVISSEEIQASPIAPAAYATFGWHDAYINGDEALQEFESRLALFESKALRGVWDEALKKTGGVPE